jgi:hypothetical protein
MSRLSAVLSNHRTARAHRVQQRELARALALAPTLESRHEILSQATRR